MLKDRKAIVRRLLTGKLLTVETFTNGTRQFRVGDDLVDGRIIRDIVGTQKDQPGTITSYRVEEHDGCLSATVDRVLIDPNVTPKGDEKIIRDHRLIREWLGCGLPLVCTKAGKRTIYEIGPHRIDGRLVQNALYGRVEPFIGGVRTVYLSPDSISDRKQNSTCVEKPFTNVKWESFKQRRRAEIEQWRKSRK